ncbi:hypothetical protein CKO36_16965 [Rhabdochromatium marinum]|nr:hypothetical protein [Rhabdochromatium marinum]
MTAREPGQSFGFEVLDHDSTDLKAGHRTGRRRQFEALGTLDHLVVAVRPDVRSGAFLEIAVNEAKGAFETKF